MLIRDERPGEAHAIADLVAQAFQTAPHASGIEAAIVEGLREHGALSLSLVAVMDAAIVGQVVFSRVVIAPGGTGTAAGEAEPFSSRSSAVDAGGWFALGPIAVVPALQHKGIGSALVREGLRRLAGDGAAGVVLVGDPAWYRRFGFAADPALHVAGIPPEYVLFRSFGAAAPAGRIRFHPAFGVAG